MPKSQHEDYESSIAIAQIGNFKEGNPKFVERNTPLMQAIGRRGFRAVALNGAKDRAGENTFSKFYVPEGDLLVAREQPINIDAAHDLSGGIGRFVPDVLALNPPAIRDLSRSKVRQTEILRKELGEAIPQTIARFASRQEIEEGLDEVESETVIVKADKDAGKEHPILIGSKGDVRSRLDELLITTTPDQMVVIQEYMPEVNGRFAPGIRYADDLEEDFAMTKQDGAREIRTHVVDEEPILVMGRVGLKVNDRTYDKWVHFDLDSVPPAIPALAVTAAKLLRQEAEVEDSHLAIDQIPTGGRIIEVNGSNIGTMRPSTERPAVQRAHKVTVTALADKLTAMATRKRSGK